MTTMELASAFASGKITEAEFKRQMGVGQGAGLIVKFNTSGGVYIKHPSFKAHSKSKDKDYIAGLNMDVEVARALFTNADTLAQVQAEVATLLK